MSNTDGTPIGDPDPTGEYPDGWHPDSLTEQEAIDSGLLPPARKLEDYGPQFGNPVADGQLAPSETVRDFPKLRYRMQQEWVDKHVELAPFRTSGATDTAEEVMRSRCFDLALAICEAVPRGQMRTEALQSLLVTKMLATEALYQAAL